MVKKILLKWVSKRDYLVGHRPKIQKVPPFKPAKTKAISKFRYDPKTKSIRVLKTPLSSYEEAHKGIGELFLKAGRTSEKVSFARLITKFPKQKIKAHKLAQLKGLKKVKALSERHGVKGLTSIKDRPKTFYKAKKGGLPKGMTLQEMGWAPTAELSAEAIAVKAAQTPKALLKKHRRTLSKIYATPKSWQQRSKLKSYYRGQSKLELGAAKVDISIFRTQTVQKLDPKTGRYKTVSKFKKMTW